MDHDYCNVPEPSSLDLACVKIEELSQEVEELNKQLNELRIHFGLEQLASSDQDIRFYTRFPSYRHLMSFWWLIKPSIHKIICVSRSK
ncbi:hypothetical protein ABG768_010627, partial [Culter alburnus]